MLGQQWSRRLVRHCLHNYETLCGDIAVGLVESWWPNVTEVPMNVGVPFNSFRPAWMSNIGKVHAKVDFERALAELSAKQRYALTGFYSIPRDIMPGRCYAAPDSECGALVASAEAEVIARLCDSVDLAEPDPDPRRQFLEHRLLCHSLGYWREVGQRFTGAAEFVYGVWSVAGTRFTPQQQRAFFLRYDTHGDGDRLATYAQVARGLGHTGKGEGARKLIGKALDKLADTLSFELLAGAEADRLQYNTYLKEQKRLLREARREAPDAERDAFIEQVYREGNLYGRASGDIIRETIVEKWGSIRQKPVEQRLVYTCKVIGRRAGRRKNLEKTWRLAD